MSLHEEIEPLSGPGQAEAKVLSKPRTRLFGFVVRKERWGLSWRGWLVATAGVLLALGLLVENVYPFLALNSPVDGRTLVVEGWVNDHVIQATVQDLKLGHSERVFTTGGPVRGGGGYTSDFRTAASICAERLMAAGAPTNLIQMVPCRKTDRDRTFSAAVALRKWFEQQNTAILNFNVITEDTHARRTRLLFEKAFHGRAKVGVISIASPDYDAKHWWRYSQGIEDVIDQTVAYLYARLLFNPPASE